ncbi:MAG: rpsA [Bacillales bacterium]|jgi:small subunit ribosomal protein S1|nr:rpsA [Bacillales bacterium]
MNQNTELKREDVNISIGNIIEGTVVKVEDKQALVDFGYKVEAILPISEISSFHVENVSDELNVNDKIKFKVISIKEDDIVISKKAVDIEEKWSTLEASYNNGELIEGKVKEVVKGGLVVDVGIRGFIPASMVSTKFVEDLSVYVGQVLPLKIIELDREKVKLVLSYKAVLEYESSKAKSDALDQIKVGDILEGTVARITNFGAFVNIGNVDGLVHISQLSYNRVNKVEEVLNVGDSVKVKVISVDKENNKISLSIKDTQENPWESEIKQLSVGQIVEGQVKRLMAFGAFVEVAPHVEGLLHVSQISSKHLSNPKDVLSVGDKVKVKIQEIDLAKKKLSLSIKQIEEDADLEELKKYQDQAKSENAGFNLSELIGDKLKKFNK